MTRLSKRSAQRAHLNYMMRVCVLKGRPVIDTFSFDHLRTRVFGILLLFCLPLAAQVQPTALPALPQSARSQLQSAELGTSDPRKPEIQPNLAQDHDPIPSPDATIPATPITAANAPADSTGLQKSQDGVYTLHDSVDEVLLNCTVVDEKGRPVEGLTRKDFRVWEEKVPQFISSFDHQDLPVSIGILVDNSGSMRDKRTTVNQGAINLLRASNRQDTAFIVNFNERPFLDQGFTSDLVALNRGLARNDSQGTTALYDAVAASADELARHSKYQKQVLLIVSDGADNASRLSREEAIRRVQNLAGPVVYTIGLLFDSEPIEIQQAREALQALSDDTGGIAYFPGSLDEVESIASQVASDIRNQYTIGYHSANTSSQDGYRVVHVEAYSPKYGKLSVRTRRGYYARPRQSGPRPMADTTAAPLSTH